MGERTYVSEVEIAFPIILKTDREDYVKREVTAYVINAEGVNFLLGKEMLKEWKVSIDYEENKMEMKEKGKNVKLIESKGGHLLAQLELVGEWNVNEAIFLVEKEKDLTNLNVVKKIHQSLNHNSKEQMYHAFRNAGKLDDRTRKTIDEVVKKCDICKRNIKSKSKLAVAISKATDFNSIVAIDLKEMGNKYILWMVCAFTKFIHGRVLKDKKP